MVRFKEPSLGQQGRRMRQQLVVDALLQQIARPDQGPALTELLARLTPQVETNLSKGEALSLLSVAMQKPRSIRFDQLPLSPPTKPDQPLRQLQPTVSMPLWPRE
jgi:anionic cell wall polymer biosynthesis LytR-Cps2A-Psr (LCP) family protein